MRSIFIFMDFRSSTSRGVSSHLTGDFSVGWSFGEHALFAIRMRCKTSSCEAQSPRPASGAAFVTDAGVGLPPNWELSSREWLHRHRR